MDEKENTFKFTHHVATGKFTYFEFEVATTLENVVKQANWLRDQFKNIEK